MKLDLLKTNQMIYELGTQKEFASKISISRQWLNKVLKNGNVTLPTAMKIAKGLNVEVKDIVILDD